MTLPQIQAPAYVKYAGAFVGGAGANIADHLITSGALTTVDMWKACGYGLMALFAFNSTSPKNQAVVDAAKPTP